MPCMDHFGHGDDRADKLAALLCQACQALDGEGMFGTCGSLEDVWKWWQEHKAADAKRNAKPSWWGK